MRKSWMSCGGFEVTESSTVGGPVTCCPRRGNPCLSVWMHTWRDCWRKPTKTRGCYGTWKIIIGRECMFAKQRWRYSKGSCPRPARGRRRPTRSVSWLRPLSLTMILISILLAANPRNFESFEAFLAFLGILQVLAIGVVSPRARPLVGTAQNGENSTFLEFSCKNTLAYGWT